ncbi:MAG: 4Fe-4S dicluster domain-containing protein [Bacteroidota bacterium]|nr:4Fe-4S dicluster domain-containing protein [Bacteroidota bacterium]
MSFSIYETDKQGLTAFYDAVAGKFETYAPVEKFGKFDYRRITKIAEGNPDSPIAATMTVKPLFFPKSSPILKFQENKEETLISNNIEGDLSSGKRVILGIRHCDARGLQVLDKVYSWDFIDTDYQKKRENTILVSTRCDKAGVNCFCTSLDYDVENSDAHDVKIVNGLNGKIYIKAVTQKGEDFLKESPVSLKLAGNDSDEEMKKQYKSFESSFRLKMNYKEINEKLQNKFDSPEFETISRNCIGCNTCAFICPTCHCFKISDEKIRDTGVRYKSYDSCNNTYFTLMAGGHNPRPVKYRRWRQRAMHKFVYYKERFGVNLCVGCGHCAISCPVNISIFEVVNKVANS